MVGSVIRSPARRDCGYSRSAPVVAINDRDASYPQVETCGYSRWAPVGAVNGRDGSLRNARHCEAVNRE